MYRRSGRSRLLLGVFLVFSIVVITLDYRQGDGGPIERAKDVSVTVIAPIQRGLTAVFRPAGNFFASIGELGRLRSENIRLKATLDDQRAQIQEAQGLVEEIGSLTRLLELEEPWQAMDSLNATVVGISPSNYRWARIIDKGSDDGVQKNMAVVNADGLVGRVIRVTQSWSTVLLLIDPKAAAGARVEGRRDTGVVQGNGESEGLSLELVGSNTEVEVGDLVMTSGYNFGIFPPGAPIGRVAQLMGDVRSPDQTIVVEPFVDFTSLDYVRVLLETGNAVAEERDAS